LTVAPTEVARKYVIEKYVRPALERGDKTIEVRIGNVLKELGWSNRTPSVFSTLSSRQFQEEAGVELIEKRDGPPSGGPSTTWRFIYRIIGSPANGATGKDPVLPNGAGLMNLAGICAGVFRKLGGGEAFLKSERNWGPDAGEKYAAEQSNQKPGDDRK
jgi:hypothetical protein